MKCAGTFPFGQPIYHVEQADRSPKTAFVLGVYSSAVHARWLAEDGKQLIQAVAVASEPEIFWRGDLKEAEQIIGRIVLPAGAGRLMPARAQFNGPSGVTLDNLILGPLGIYREDAWLCDLTPHSCMNRGQKTRLESAYIPRQRLLNLPTYDWQKAPTHFADQARRQEIEADILESGADLLITLGDKPLDDFARYYGAFRHLRDYGVDRQTYGKLHRFCVGGKTIRLLPLCHTRQAEGKNISSLDWYNAHRDWEPPKI